MIRYEASRRQLRGRHHRRLRRDRHRLPGQGGYGCSRHEQGGSPDMQAHALGHFRCGCPPRRPGCRISLRTGISEREQSVAARRNGPSSAVVETSRIDPSTTTGPDVLTRNCHERGRCAATNYEPRPGPGEADTEPSPVQAVSFVTTEHFALQSARAATIAESTGRATMFLASISGGLIALGLVATASHLGTAFYAFGLVLLPTLAFVGLVTFERALQSAMDDHLLARRIALLRGYYLDNAPELTRYLVRQRLRRQPRWHDGRLWFSDWGTNEIIAIDLDGHRDVIGPGGAGAAVNWLPDGRMLVTGAELQRVGARRIACPARRLGHISSFGWSELTVDGRGNAYVNRSTSTSENSPTFSQAGRRRERSRLSRPTARRARSRTGWPSLMAWS